jgi:murein DD-endopeptidase MepM/ murein hydrolase activator NlpD
MSASWSRGLLVGLLVPVVVVAITTLNGSPTPVPTEAALGTRVAASPIASTRTVAKSQTRTATPSAIPALATATLLPIPVPTRASDGSSTPTVTITPPSTAGVERIIGHSVQGRPIVAHRIGEGPIKVALIGNIHGDFEKNTHVLARQLVAHFVAHPGEVPAHVSLWIIPTINPDGLATGHRWNANGVDLNRNADTDLDGCAGNDWTTDTVGLEGPHPGAGGEYPFSEPESRLLRDFLADSWIAIFYHSAAEAIFRDACQRHAPTARLAVTLSEGSGYPVPEEGWAGYRITGDFGDYLAGDGVAAVTVELSDHDDPEFDRNLEGVRSVLAAVDEILSAEASEAEADVVWLDDSTSGTWRLSEGSFVHPLALEVLGDFVYALEGGRVLAFDLVQRDTPRVLLAPGDNVGGTRVLEPLDLASDGLQLLAMDRAGDVYRYDPADDSWVVERQDRAVRDTYDHYFVTISSSGGDRYLLETTHEEVWRYAPGHPGAAWAKLPKSRDVDLSVISNDVYVLARSLNSPTADLMRYDDGHAVAGFAQSVDSMHPRQIHATEKNLFVLDRSGRRLLVLEPDSGDLDTVIQFTDRRTVSAVWADSTGRILLAGRDALYLLDRLDLRVATDGLPASETPQSHDSAVLESLRGLQVPIEDAKVTSRDFQMPGAPRHYRLGVHEGIDFYGHTVGVPVNRRTPVRAVANGTVIRALTDYLPPTPAQANVQANQSRSLGYTPPEVLDAYRGMQVWIDHGSGLVSRYAHLSSVAPGVQVGAVITRGQIIATVGNSGTPASLDSETADVHLHLELWMGDHYIGQFLRPIETREWIERILR